VLANGLSESASTFPCAAAAQGNQTDHPKRCPLSTDNLQEQGAPMPFRSPCFVGPACLVVLAAGCAPKGNMAHVKVESTAFAAQQGLTVKNWSWSGGKFSVQLATSKEYKGGFILFAQVVDAKGGGIGQEIKFLNYNMKPGTTEWVEIPDLKLTDQAARVAFDLQSSLSSRRESHY
jgi:hypothetical protein